MQAPEAQDRAPSFLPNGKNCNGDFNSLSSNLKHFVHFYENDAALVERVAAFIGGGVGAGEGGVVIATPEHRKAIAKRLVAQGVDLANVEARRQYLAIDAQEALGKFMENGSPDPAGFAEVVGGIIDQAGTGRPGVRAFGEMVALLWAEGNSVGAKLLEELWNELREKRAFSLFCAYPLIGFAEAENSEDFRHICQSHSCVLPSENILSGTEDEKLREIAALQQKAQALETEIKERRRVEDMLKLGSRLPAENPSPVLRLCRDGILQFANPKAQELLAKWDAHVGGSAPEPIRRLIGDATRHDSEVALGERFYAVATVPASDNAFINLYFTDITSRKQAEENLRQSEKRHRQLLSIMPSAVYTCDREGRITFYNRKAVELWGCEPKLNDDQQKFCAMHKCFFNGRLLHPQETPMAVAVREGKAFRDLEPTIERPDGTRLSVLVNIDPLFDSDGTPAGAINVFQDLTQLKRTQEELKIREEHLRTIVENTPECIKLVAEDGTLLDMNGAGLCMVEADAVENVIGKNVYNVVAPEYREPFRAMNERVCAGKRERLEFEIIGLKGTRRWMETHAAPITDPMSHRQVQVAITRDITERRNSEMALRDSQVQLQAELADSKLLQAISTEIVSESNIEALYEKLVHAASAVMRSDFASMQMYCPERGGGELHLLAVKGFGPEAAKAWEWVSRASPSSCGEALRQGKRVVSVDVEQCKFLGIDGLAAYRVAGIAAMQSTPLFSRSGELLGMLSTHWGKPHQPRERELRLFDILARLAADVIERRRAEASLGESKALLEGQKNAFQAAMKGCSLEDSLNVLVRLAVEFTAGRARAAFFLTRPDGKTLRHVVGMTKEYAFDVDGFVIGGDSLACGLAMHLRQPIITPDVEKEPRWEPWRWMARKHDYRACWSFPVHTQDGPVFGTFAMYFREPYEPTPAEMELATVIAHAATVIISRHQQSVERGQAEQALRDTNERLTKVLEIETVGVMFWDLTTGCLVDANDTFLRMMGYSRAEVESRSLTWEKFTPPEYHQISRAEIMKFRETGRVGPYEKEYFHKDGSRRWLLFAGSSLGKNHCVEFCVDVADRKKAEQALLESEERYRATFENAAVGIAHISLDGRWLRFNDVICGITGYSRCELERMTFADITHPDDLEEDWRHARQLVAGQVSRYSLEKRYIRKDKSVVWVTLTVSLIHDPSGQPLHYVSVIENIDERKRAEALVIGQKEILHSIAEDAPLNEILEKILEVIERNSPGLIGSILLLDEDGVHLRPFAGKRVPEDWSKAITPLRIGPTVGSCGTAAYRNAPVIAEDIATDPLWEEYKEVAMGYGFRACWSIPMRTRDGKVLGTFASYYAEPRRPTDLEWKVVEVFAQTAALAIERQRVHDAHRQLASITEHSPNFVGVADFQQRALFLNLAGQKMVGVRPDQVTRTRILDYFPEDEKLRVEREIIPQLLARGHWDGMVFFRHFENGRRIPVMWNVFIIPDPKTGEPAFFACVSTDITERKRSEDLLEAQKISLELLLRGAPLSEVLSSLTRIVESHCQDAVASILLLDENNRFHNGASPSLPEDYLKAIDGLEARADLGTCARAAVIKERVITLDFETDPFWKDIKHLPLGIGMRAAWSLPILARNGRVLGTFGTYFRQARPPTEMELQIVEILARTAALAIEGKAAEEALRKSEERFRALVERSPFGIYVVDSDFRIAVMNQSSQDGAFQNVRPAVGRDFAEAMSIVWPEPVAAEVIRLFRHTLETGEPYCSKDFVNQRHDIDQIEGYEWELHRVALPDGRYGVICYYFDATKLRDTEARLRNAHTQLADRAVHLENLVQERTATLREAIEQMEEFSYSVSHDLRGPLRAMNAYAGVLIEEYGSELDETARNYLEKIQRSSERMNRLTQDVLAYSRVARSHAQPEIVDLERLARDIINQHTTLQSPAAKVEIVGALPAVLGHETTLGQSLSNLMNNAVKFVAPGVKPHVRLHAECQDKLVRLWVEDNGIGIKPEHQKRIFNMFERVHPDTKYEGTGIGLTIVRKALEKMGGKVGVESDGQNGSRFWIELPNAESLSCERN